MKNFITLLLAVAICFCSLNGEPARAADTTMLETITMFVPKTDWPPYLISDSGASGGVLVDVLKEVAEPLGYTIKTERLPNKRGWFLLENGEVNVHAKAKEWVAHPEDYLWTDPFMLNEDVLLYLANNSYQCSDKESLYGKKVAAIEGFIYPALEPHFGIDKIKRINVTSPYAMLELLAMGRVDAALVNRTETQWLFRNRPDLHPERFRFDEKPCDSAGYRYVFTKDDKWKPFIKAFNKELKAMKQDGRLDAILDQYR